MLVCKRLCCMLGSLLVVFGVVAQTVGSATAEGLSQKELTELYNNTNWVAFTSSGVVGGSCSLASGAASDDTNKDYAGNTILTQAQLELVAKNKPMYVKAADQADIPWQLLAAVHFRENGLGTGNPLRADDPKTPAVDESKTSDGPYQIVNAGYTPGQVTDQEFLKETIDAANFIKQKAASNYPNHRSLTKTSDADTIKDTLFSYNGRADPYAAQAASLGYSSTTQAYEGSPYVMNKADKKRDPNTNPTGWGQIKQNGGPIEYPANQAYGGFVVYAALSGLKITCGGGKFAWPEPIPSYITSCYGQRTDPISGGSSFHPGIDISTGDGAPIYAAADGTVTFAGPASGYGNNFVVIQHGAAFGSSYGHMSSALVKTGDMVVQGQQIGTQGNQGASVGSHLHFNIFPGDYKGSDAANIDPLQAGLAIPSGVINPNKCR